jgi:hypothetical protein
MNSATAGLNFEAMDVFGYDRLFPSVQEGSDDKGTQEKGQINDHVDC